MAMILRRAPQGFANRVPATLRGPVGDGWFRPLRRRPERGGELHDGRAVRGLDDPDQSGEELLPRVPRPLLPRGRGPQPVFHLVPLAELDQLLQPLAARLEPVLLLVLAAEFR